MQQEIRQSTRNLLAELVALLLLSGLVLGVLGFALMGLAGYITGKYELSLISLVAIGGLLGGFVAFLRRSP
jgi:hypothetical protein